MSRLSRFQGNTSCIAVAAIFYLLNTAWAHAGAEPMGNPDLNFDERFSLEHRAEPIFARPDVQQLLSSVQPPAASVESAWVEPSGPDPAFTGRVGFAQRKGPAKVLKELLATPVKELLVSPAEAGPESSPSTEAAVAAAPSNVRAPQPAPTQDVAAAPVPAEPPAQEPRSERAVAALESREPPVAPRTAPASPAQPAVDEHDARAARDAAPHASPSAAQPAPALNPPAEVAASAAVLAQAPAEPPAAMAQPLPRPPAPSRTAEEKPDRAPALQPAAERAATPRPEPRTTADVRGGRRVGTGRATWYQHPGRTASGETFNPNQLTAAHHTLPFGTRVRVVHEGTGRAVAVRINDRIPRTTRVLIDLSRASAKALGVDGVARVSLYEP